MILPYKGSMDVTVPRGYVCDWEWKWDRSQQQISRQWRENDQEMSHEVRART